MLWLGCGFTLFQVVLVLWLWAGGALGEYIAATRFASGYTSLGGPYSPEGMTVGNYLNAFRYAIVWWALSRVVLSVPALIGGFLALFVLRERRAVQVTLFVLVAYAGIAAQAKFFPYHWLYMLPFVALLAGWTWDRALALLAARAPRGRALAGSAVLVAGLLIATPDVTDTGWNQWKSAVHYETRPEEREYFYDYFGAWNGGAFSYRASREVSRYVNSRTAPGEHLYVWGYDPLIYLLADRPIASRFIYSFPLMSGWAPGAWQGEFLRELEERPPGYFIVQRYEGARWITGHQIDTGDYIAWFPELERWLRAHYRLEAEIEDYLIYHRRAAG
jgi:hypothetical protein